MNMQEQPKERPEKQQNAPRPKSPYATPTLVRLGNVRQLTQGYPFGPPGDDLQIGSGPI